MNEEAKREKELVCIFLGLNFYASPGKAKILKSRVEDLILKHLAKEELISIDVEPAIDFTPTFTSIKEKLKKSED